MSRYAPIRTWLDGLDADVVHVNFSELDALVGPLPASARTNRTWWGNSLRQPHASTWLSAGWKVDGVDLAAERVTFLRGAAASRPGSGREPVLDGTRSLELALERAGWASVDAAVAAHVLFIHPATVAQARGQAIVPVARDMTRRGQFGVTADGRNVLFDDNTTPTDVFLWSINRRRGPDVQFNHVWTCSSDPNSYTALWNLCCTPAFLAKATDSHPLVLAALQYRAWELYGARPAGFEEPHRPEGYEKLEWAPMLEPTKHLEQVLRDRMRSAPGKRATLAARTLGWVFSDGPDATV